MFIPGFSLDSYFDLSFPFGTLCGLWMACDVGRCQRLPERYEFEVKDKGHVQGEGEDAGKAVGEGTLCRRWIACDVGRCW